MEVRYYLRKYQENGEIASTKDSRTEKSALLETASEKLLKHKNQKLKLDIIA